MYTSTAINDNIPQKEGTDAEVPCQLLMSIAIVNFFDKIVMIIKI